ncbi:hypothetical protein [Nakamurella sp.]|uniref:hypothetical protein n=1 Tax=Nakamurella sp. TaxID=1869182 RepID=UPI003B3AEA8F
MPAAPTLPADVRATLLDGRGLIRAADFEGTSGSRSRLHRLERAGLLTGLAKGVYADTATLRSAGEWSAFRLRTRAFLMVAAPDSYASDWSSIVLHDLPTRGRPPTVPNVIRPGSRVSGSNTTRWGRTRFAAVPDRWLGQVDGCPAVDPAFAAVDVARQADRLTGLVLADAVAFRHRGRDRLAQAAVDVERWRGGRRARWPVQHCDADVESPLESAGRLAFLDAGLPGSLSNVWVGDIVPEARLDHYWPAFRIAAEGDGVGKYLLTDPAAAIRREKEREWLLQQWGIRVVRYTWAVATRSPDELTGRIRALMRVAPDTSCALRLWPRDEGLALLGLPSGRPRPRPVAAA